MILPRVPVPTECAQGIMKGKMLFLRICNYLFALVLLGSKFMRSLAQDGAVDEETLSTQELDNLYSPLREQVSDSLHRQELLLSKIQV